MKKTILLLLILFTYGNSIFAQNELNEIDKLASTSRIWGFLKYYHPEVAKGTFNWDEQLNEILPKVEKATTKEQLSQVYLNWIASLGEVKECKKCNKPTKKVYFEKNFNLSWTQNSIFFTSQLSEKLEYIENNRNQKENYYVSAAKRAGNVVIQNETKYEDFTYPNKHYRLLCLFKYWNVIEYFFPYKYQTDQNWNAVLTEMIPKFRDAQNATEYHLAMLEMVTKIDDSHTPLFYTEQLISFFGKLEIPIKYKIIDDKLVITDFRYKNVAKIDDLQIGDAIIEMDGVTIRELIKNQSKYTPASNQKGKERNSFFISLGHKNTVSIKYERNGEIFKKEIHRYHFSTLEKKNAVLDKTKWKFFNKNIAYVKVGNINSHDIDNIMDSVITTKGIILDLRSAFKKGTGGIIPRFSRRLFSEEKEFAKIIQPDMQYPGKYFWKKNKVSGIKNKNYYKGKVIILVDNHTQSSLEYITMCFQNAPDVITIGEQSAGADGNVSRFKLVGEYNTKISGIGIFYPDGTETQRKGVKIDIEVHPTVEGIIDGRDEILERAIDYLNTEFLNSNK